MATTEELNEVWEILINAFPSNKVTDGTAAVYATTLSDLDGILLRAAASDS